MPGIDCEICGKELPKRFRRFCSTTCRVKFYNKKSYKSQQEWQKRKTGEYKEGKLQCQVCGRWYIQIGSHVVQEHGLTARQYKELYNLPVKKGYVPGWYREKKAKQALANGTFKNLEAGKEYRYIKGDPRAKVITGLKGKVNSTKKHNAIYNYNE